MAFGAGSATADVVGRLRVVPRIGEPAAKQGITRLKPKDKYGFEVTNPGQTPFYPYIVELATDGTVGVLYPQPERRAERVAPGKSLVWPKGTHVLAGTVLGKQHFALLASKEPLSDIRRLELTPRPYSCSGTRGSTPPPPESASPWHLSFEEVVIEATTAPASQTPGADQGQ